MPDEEYQGNGSVVWREHGEVLGDDGREVMADELYKLQVTHSFGFYMEWIRSHW